MSQQIPKPLWILGISSTPLPQTFENHIGKDLYEILHPEGKKITTTELITKHPNEPINRYIFFELDIVNPEALEYCIKTFKEMNLGVLVHKTGRGYHFFAERRSASTQREITEKLLQFRTDECSYNTLRISKKYENEVYEPALWYGGERPSWCKALQYFIAREARGEAQHDFNDNIHRTGLTKYFVTTIYPLCPICRESLTVSNEGKILHFKQKHNMEVS